MNSYVSISQQREPPPSSPVAGGESPLILQYRFLEKFRREPENMWNKQSIYRIPTLIRELNPKAYEPRVVSIGPYHHGKEQFEPMDEHKHRAIKHYLNRREDTPIRFDEVFAEFREEGFLEKVMNCYAKPLDQQWCDDYAFLHLMVLDGCFVLELLLCASEINKCPGDPQPEWCYAPYDPIFGVHGHAERHGVVPYVKMDMLLLENQIPLIVLEKLARIANLDVDINVLIWSFYGCKYRQTRSNHRPGLHVLDVYRKGRLSYGDYDGWAVPKSAKELNDFGIHFQPSSGGGAGDGLVGVGSFKDVVFEKGKERDILGKIYDHFMEPAFQRQPQVNSSVSGLFRRVIPLRLIPSLTWRFPCARQTTEWYITSAFLWAIHVILSAFFYVTIWWYFPLWVTKGNISLPLLTIDETTAPILLNLMAFERLHLGREGRDMTVTHYVFLMSSLVRSQKDVEHLRKKSVLSCVPGRSDESVVMLFAGITENVVLDDIRGKGKINKEIKTLCERRPNRWQATWLRHYGSDLKTWITVLLTSYGVAFGLVNTVMVVLNYIVVSNRRPILCN